MSDFLIWSAIAILAYIYGWYHGANWCKHFIERKANVKIIDTSTVTIVPKEPPCPPPAKP